MDKLVYKTLKDYFKTLSLTGYKSYDVVSKILVVSFIEELTNTELRYFLTENDYKLMTDLLYQLFGSTCEVSFPENCIKCSNQPSPSKKLTLSIKSDSVSTLIINNEVKDLPYTYTGDLGDRITIQALEIEGFQFDGFYEDNVLIEGNSIDIVLTKNTEIDVRYLEEKTYNINITGNAQSTTKLSLEVEGNTEEIVPNSTGKSYSIISTGNPQITLNSLSDTSGIIISLNNIQINGQEYSELPVTITLPEETTNIVFDIASSEPDRVLTFKSIGIPYTIEYGLTSSYGNTVTVESGDVQRTISASDVSSSKNLYYRITIKDNYSLDNIVFRGNTTSRTLTTISGIAQLVLYNYNLDIIPEIYTTVYFGAIDATRTAFPSTVLGYQGTKAYTLTNNQILDIVDTAGNIGVADKKIFFIMAPVNTSVRITMLKFGTAPFETVLWSDNGISVQGSDMFTGPEFNETKSDGTNLKHMYSDVSGAIIEGKTYYVYYYYASAGCFSSTDPITCQIRNI